MQIKHLRKVARMNDRASHNYVFTSFDTVGYSAVLTRMEQLADHHVLQYDAPGAMDGAVVVGSLAFALDLGHQRINEGIFARLNSHVLSYSAMSAQILLICTSSLLFKRLASCSIVFVNSCSTRSICTV